MFNVKIKNDFIVTFKTKSLFFIHKEIKQHYENGFGYIYDGFFWVSKNDNIDFEAKYNFNEYLDCVLMLADVEIDDNKSWCEYSCHEMNINSVEVMIRVIISVIDNDEYKFKYLLWCLNYCCWRSDVLLSAIHQLNDFNKNIVLDIISKIGRCLSINKQEQIRSVLLEFNLEYKIYSEISIDENKNLFENIDSIIEDGCVCHESSKSLYALNCLHEWLDSNGLVENWMLKDYYPLLKPKIKLSVIRRYFFDVELGNLSFDIDLFRTFRNNRMNVYARCRDCIESPDAPIDITSELLCDSIIALKESNGHSFLEMDGVLDMAIQKCDVENPKIKFNLDEIFPTCNGGAVYNEEFVGFIDYAIIFELDADLSDDNVIQQRLKHFFDTKFSRKEYCIYEGESVELMSWEKCKKNDCAYLKSCDNVWVVPEIDLIWLNAYLIKPIEGRENSELKLLEVSCEKIRQKIEELLRIDTMQFELGESTCLVKSEQLNKLDELIKDFFRPLKIRIYPKSYTLGLLCKFQENSYRVVDFNLSGLEIQESLKNYLGEVSTRSDYYEIPYNEKKLRDLRDLFYFKKNDGKNAIESCFLKKERQNSNKCCTPDINWEKHCATGLSYYWCMGKVCFRSNLEQHVSGKLKWSEYTILNISRILGYEKIRTAKNGLYELSKEVKDFAAIISKANKRFKQLRCRVCGHLLFPIRQESRNRYYYFRCINDKCNEYNARIYLNYCYNCKKGLIDSRDTKQCENGKYICRECLACCNDNMYERLARTIVQHGREISYKLRMSLGTGNNNKGIFFCPDCGSQLSRIDSKRMYCGQCKRNFITEYECEE